LILGGQRTNKMSNLDKQSLNAAVNTNKYIKEFGAKIVELQSLNFKPVNFVKGHEFAEFCDKHNKYAAETNSKIQRLFDRILNGDIKLLNDCINAILLLNNSQEKFEGLSHQIVKNFDVSLIFYRQKVIEEWAKYLSDESYLRLKYEFVKQILKLSAFDKVLEYVQNAFSENEAIIEWFIYLAVNRYKSEEDASRSGNLLTEDEHGAKAYNMAIRQKIDIFQPDKVLGSQKKVKAEAESAVKNAETAQSEIEQYGKKIDDKIRIIENTIDDIKTEVTNVQSAKIDNSIDAAEINLSNAKTFLTKIESDYEKIVGFDKNAKALQVDFLKLSNKADKNNEAHDQYIKIADNSKELIEQNAAKVRQSERLVQLARESVNNISDIVVEINKAIDEERKRIENEEKEARLEQERLERERQDELEHRKNQLYNVRQTYINVSNLCIAGVVLVLFVCWLVLLSALWSQNTVLNRAFPFSHVGRATMAFACIALITIFVFNVIIIIWSTLLCRLKQKNECIDYRFQSIFSEVMDSWFNVSKLGKHTYITENINTIEECKNIEDDIYYKKGKALYDKTPSRIRNMRDKDVFIAKTTIIYGVALIALIISCVAIGLIGSYTAKYDGYENGWYYTEDKGEITLKSYMGEEANIVVPESIDNLPIVAIDGAFKNSNAETIILHENIKYIATGSFESCNNLVNLTLPFIGDGNSNTEFYTIFGQNFAAIPKSICSLTFLEGTTFVEEYAFADMENLVSVSLPSTVTYVGKGAFAGCKNLQFLQIPFVGASLDAVEDKVLFGYIFGTKIYAGMQSTLQYALPDAYGIVRSAYYSIPSNLTHITVLGGKIKDGAFFNCSKISALTLGNNITAIGNYAFSGCVSLVEVRFSENIEHISSNAFVNSQINNWINIEEEGALYIGKVLYKYIGKISSDYLVKVDDGTTQIFDYAFFSQTNLGKIYLPISLLEIGSDAFCGVNPSLTVDYAGNEDEWNKIIIARGNEVLI